MGANVAYTGLVLMIFGAIIGSLAYSPPRQNDLVRVFGSLMLIGIFMIPIGLIIQIWQ